MVADRLGNDIAPEIQALYDDDLDEELESHDSDSSIDPEYENVAIVITGTRDTFVLDDVCYKKVGGDLVGYNPDIRAWGGFTYPHPVRVVRPHTILRNVSEGRVGSCELGGDQVFVTNSPFEIIRDFVIEAKHHKWFKMFRRFLADAGSNAMNVATLGYYDFWPEHPFRYLTKHRKDIMISSAMYSYLCENKISSGVTPDNVLLLSRIIFRDFKYLPIEILIETLLFFTFQRAAMRSEMMATTVPLSDYLNAGKRFKAYREPMNTNYVAGMLIAGEDEITQEGWYSINSVEEVKLWDVKGFVSVNRLPYVPSSEEHGDGLRRTKPPGYKFEMVRRRGFNEGCTFYDPYPFFSYNSDDRYESKSYQTVGGCFATAMQVIDGKLTREVERCFLRLSMMRPNEFELRRAQIDAVTPALVDGCRRTGDLDDRLTARIIETDPDYVQDATHMFHELTPLQMLIRDTHATYQALEMDPADHAAILADPLKAIHRYIDIIAGPKMVKRHQDLDRYYKDVAIAPKKFNIVKFKPDEPQKFKETANKKSVLKFGRATISIEGSEWIRANPPMMYAMKHIIEHEMTIVKIAIPVDGQNPLLHGPQVRGAVIEIDGVRTVTEVLPQYDLWYRAVLSDTNLDDLAAIDAQMFEWVNSGPFRMAAISHGDDIDILKSDGQGCIAAVEADIADNDGSYTDSLLRLEMQEVGMNCDPLEAYAQLANPLLLINPSKETEKILLRSTLGMIRCSGGIGTTYGNSKGSFLVILAYALRGREVSVEVAARDVGFNVTFDEFTPNESCFLSTFRYDGPDSRGVVRGQRMKCLASIARNFGRCSGDLPGRNNIRISDRWLEYVRGVVKGYVGEPDSLFLRSLRVKYDSLSLTRICDSLKSNSLSCIDRGIIRHYYNDEDQERGAEEYLACVRLIQSSPAFGSVIACPFIDQIMKKRYKMAPVIRG
jgi:hypothetical protein